MPYGHNVIGLLILVEMSQKKSPQIWKYYSIQNKMVLVHIRVKTLFNIKVSPLIIYHLSVMLKIYIYAYMYVWFFAYSYIGGVRQCFFRGDEQQDFANPWRGAPSLGKAGWTHLISDGCTSQPWRTPIELCRENLQRTCLSSESQTINFADLENNYFF